MDIELTIIIVNWNKKKLLSDCLTSLYKYTQGITFEVYVVDNASIDGSQELVKTNFSQVHLLENRTNAGFAKANNQAIRLSKGNYILLLNNDTILIDNIFPRMVTFLKKQRDAAVAGCKLTNADGSFQTSFGRFPTLSTLLIESLRLYIIFPFLRKFTSTAITDDRGITEPLPVDYVSGACLMVKRSIVEEIGLLDEDFFAYYEETDWCYRIKTRGYKIYYLPVLSLIHLKNQSVKELSNAGLKLTKESMYKYFKKRYTLKLIRPFIYFFIFIWYSTLWVRKKIWLRG